MTTLDERKKALRELATDPAALSVAGQVRASLQEIDAAMVAGVRQEKIIAALGLNISLPTFRKTLYRIRKEVGSSVSGPHHETTAATNGVAKRPLSTDKSPLGQLKDNHDVKPGRNPELDRFFEET